MITTIRYAKNRQAWVVKQKSGGDVTSTAIFIGEDAENRARAHCSMLVCKQLRVEMSDPVRTVVDRIIENQRAEIPEHPPAPVQPVAKSAAEESYAYIKKAYGVSPKVGGRVTVYGHPAVILAPGASGHYLRVKRDDHATPSFVHPTEEIVYLPDDPAIVAAG